MFRNYLKIAFRNLHRQAGYSSINILGLTLGIACFFIIVLYISDELLFDGMHSNQDRIYRVIEHKIDVNGNESYVAPVAYQLSEQGPALIPEIEEAARILSIGRAIVRDAASENQTFYEEIWLANQDFLDIFDFPLLKGNRETALEDPYSVLMTNETAEKLFGTTDVIGRSVSMDRDTNLFTISGILEDFPKNSHLQFNLIFAENSLQSDNYRSFVGMDWSSNNFHTYLLTNPEANANEVQSKINDLAKENMPETTLGNNTYSLQKLREIHFNSGQIEENLGVQGNKQFLYILSIIGIFLLVIACINYMNLTTARFGTRLKEIAVRKVTGANRKSLSGQFLFEAIFLTLIAVLSSTLLVWLFLPVFNSFTGKELSLSPGVHPMIWIGMIPFILIVGLIAGIYPSIIQSRFNPFQLLKGNKLPASKGLNLRRGLVIFQFTLSIIMIAATLVVYLQLRYMENKDMGFNKDRLLVMDINSSAIRSSAFSIMDEMSSLSSVSNTSATSRVPGEWKGIPQVFVNYAPNQVRDNEMYFLGVDDAFLSTFQIDLLSGENFEFNNLSDSSAILINETAAQILGVTNAEHQMVEIPMANFYGNIRNLNAPFKAKIKGIVKDFNFQSLKDPIAPVVLGFHRNPIHRIDYITARIAGDNPENTLTQLEGIYHDFDPQHLFEYHFLENQWDSFYLEDKRRNVMVISSAALTILIACMGLFGLAAFASQQRRKEIGIRKVLGASTFNIMSILAIEFVKNVCIAILCGIPIAYVIMNNWLNNFAFKISLDWWFFIVPGLTSLVIAIATVSIQTIRAAIGSPVNSLRIE